MRPLERATPAERGDERSMLPTTSNVSLRHVVPSDIEVFFEQQSEPEGSLMAAFPSRGREAHFAHWAKILEDDTLIARTIVDGSEVAGNIGSWIQDNHREVGYWIGKAFWGRGIATAALRQFLEVVQERPLFAWVARHNGGSMRVLQKCGFVFDRDEDDHVVFKIV